MKLRVSVDPAGNVASASAFDGFEALCTYVERAIKTSKFPAKAKPYVVDVDVEVRK